MPRLQTGRIQKKFPCVKEKGTPDSQAGWEGLKRVKKNPDGRKTCVRIYVLRRVGLLCDYLGNIAGFINFVLDRGYLFNSRQTLFQIQTGILHVIKPPFKRADRLAEAGTDLREFFTAKKQKGNSKYDYKLRGTKSKHDLFLAKKINLRGDSP